MGALDAREVRPHSLVLRRPGGELWVDGRVQTGEYGDDDALDARVRITNWPARRPRPGAGLGRRGGGPGLGRGRAHRPAQRRPRFRPPRRARAGRYYGVPYEDLDVRTRLHGRVTEVTDGRARVGGGTVDLRGHRHRRRDLRRPRACGRARRGRPPARRAAAAAAGRARVGDGPPPGDAGASAGGGRRSRSPRLFLGRRGRGRRCRGGSSAPATAACPSTRAAARPAWTSPCAATVGVGRALRGRADRDRASETSLDPVPARRRPRPCRPPWAWWARATLSLRGPLATPRAPGRGGGGARPAGLAARLSGPEPRPAAPAPGRRDRSRCGAWSCPAKAPTWRWRARPRWSATAPSTSPCAAPPTCARSPS